MKLIRRGSFITIGILLIILGVFKYFNKNITVFFLNIIRSGETVELTYKNDYYNNYQYNYVKLVDDFNNFNRTDLTNIYYTIINSGINEFSFNCPNDYEECVDDIAYLADDQKTLSNINGFIHPFNSFSTVYTSYDNFGKITIKVNRSYTEEEVKAITEKVNYVITNVIKNETNKREIIKLAHDYIINNSKYDQQKSDNKVTNYSSSIAYGPLIEGYAICGGYTDAMAIFLNYYNIPNYKIFSQNHIWNAVNLDGKWYHLDLTWDDPITDNGDDILDYTYFLITTKQLEQLNDGQHSFDKSIFKEFA